MGNAIINGGGVGADSDELTAYKQHILEGYTAVTHDSDGEPINGTMANLSNRSKITHTSSNSTKVIQGDEAYLATNSDGVARAEIRYNGDVGYITGNTLFGIEQSKMAAAIGLTTTKLVKGSNVLGISGDAMNAWTGDCTALQQHVLSPYTYVSKGIKYQGTMPSKVSGQIANSVQTYQNHLYYRIPYGYYPNSYTSTECEVRAPFSIIANAIGLTAGKLVQGQSCLGIQGTVPKITIKTYKASVRSSSSRLEFLSYNDRTISYPYIDVNVGFSNILHAEALYDSNTVYHTFYTNGGNYFIINYGQDFCAAARAEGPNFILGTNNIVRIPVTNSSTAYNVCVIGY